MADRLANSKAYNTILAREQGRKGHRIQKRRKKEAARRDESPESNAQRQQKRQQEEAGRLEKRLRAFDNAAALVVPEGYSLSDLQQIDSETYQRARQGEVISAGPMHSPQVNAIIFFNELDKFHTFNFANQLARANAGLVTTAVNEGEEEKVEPKILFPYLLACFENRDYPGVFHHRFRFLELWQASQQDLKVFSRRQLDRYDAFARSLDRQLAETLPDIGDSGLSSTREMQDALKEDEDMDDAANGIINNEGRRYANAVKEGRLRMEDVMENQSTSFGGVWEDEDDGSQVQWADIAPAKQYADWVDMCLDMCELQLKIARTKRDHKHLLRVHHKMERLIMDEDVRKLCTKYGFAGYGQ